MVVRINRLWDAEIRATIDAWFPDNRKGIHSVSGKVRRPAR
ncbi:MAG: hypothetical protein ACLU6F_05695 [[Ruminococcus] torques]